MVKLQSIIADLKLFLARLQEESIDLKASVAYLQDKDAY